MKVDSCVGSHSPATMETTTDAPDERRRLLLVASTGGHLAQLFRMSSRLGASDDSTWITFDSPQSRSLLEGRDTVFVPYIRPRDWRATFRAARLVGEVLDRGVYDQAVSTGAALAVAALPQARRRGIATKYIESVSRVQGPSLSGRILRFAGIDELYTQHAQWADRRWREHWSVLDTYGARRVRAPAENPRLFVTLGTIEGHRFDEMVDAVLRTGLCNESTVWQLGETSRNDLPGTVHQSMSAEAFDVAARAADVVISHAGVGSLLNFLDAGIRPVLVVRRRSRGEHIDDHQEQIATLAHHAGVASSLEAPELDRDHLVSAGGWEVHRLVDS